MLNTGNTNQVEIAVRLYDNPVYGTTHGKGLYRRAIFNGSIDVTDPQVKYVIDLYSYDDWANQATTDGQMEVINGFEVQKDTLYSWIKRYNAISKEKILVDGFCRIDLQTNDMLVLIADVEFGVTDTWKLAAKPCKQRLGCKSPQLLATNAVQLDAAQQRTAPQSSNQLLRSSVKAFLEANAH